MAKIRVYAKQITTEKGNTFTALSLVSQRHKGTNVKFTQDCVADFNVKLPRENGYYLIEAENDGLSLARGVKGEDGKWTKYPCLWVRGGFIGIERDIKYEAQIKALKAQEIDMLDVSDDENENVFE